MTRLPARDLNHILSHTRDLWDDLRGRTIFFTGCTGFVGMWLIESLLCANDRLDLGVSVVGLTRNPERFREKAPHLAGHPTVRLLRGNMVGFEYPEGQYPFVIHAATEPPLAPDITNPLGVFPADVQGTRNVLEFARRAGTRRLLFVSSGGIYGKQPSQMTHIPEDYTGAPSTMDIGSAYGQAKRVSEFMCAMYARAYGFDATIARLFTFVGPLLPLDARYAVGNFIQDALRGDPVRVAGDGTPYRSYLYAADMAVWLWTILLRGKPSRPYNVGSSEAITIAHLAQTVAQHTGAMEIAGEPVRGAPAERYVPSTTRAHAELGLRHWIDLKEALRRTLEWHRSGDLRATRPPP